MAEVQSVTVQISHSFAGDPLLLHYPASEMAGVAVAHTGRGANSCLDSQAHLSVRASHFKKTEVTLHIESLKPCLYHNKTLWRLTEFFKIIIIIITKHGTNYYQFRAKCWSKIGFRPICLLYHWKLHAHTHTAIWWAFQRCTYSHPLFFSPLNANIPMVWSSLCPWRALCCTLD